ncbi:MAG: hypothetical protein K0U66_05350 [Gammaproteobacteria bacterium]|nr:hypothetical protein [Gammaproteobacteria bacterium]
MYHLQRQRRATLLLRAREHTQRRCNPPPLCTQLMRTPSADSATAPSTALNTKSPRKHPTARISGVNKPSTPKHPTARISGVNKPSTPIHADLPGTLADSRGSNAVPCTTI